MSQATFFRPNRRLVNLWHLPLCFVDLDTYKTAYGKLHEEPLSLAVWQRLTDEGIPPASLVIHSGGGRATGGLGDGKPAKILLLLSVQI